MTPEALAALLKRYSAEELQKEMCLIQVGKEYTASAVEIEFPSKPSANPDSSQFDQMAVQRSAANTTLRKWKRKGW